MKRLAMKLGVTTRTLRRWRRQSSKGWPGPGRPGHPVHERRDALKWVRRALKKLGARCGLGTVSAWLASQGRALSTRLVRWALAEWKRHLRTRMQRRIEAVRVQAHVLQRDVLWVQDAMHLFGSGADASWGRVVRDRCTREHVALSLSGPPCSAQSVALLERARVEEGRLPLVLGTDNGGENRGKLVAWARQHRVVLLRSVPHTPQHNGAAERTIGELREELAVLHAQRAQAAYRASAEWPGLSERLPDDLARARERLDKERPRRCLNGRTAQEVAQSPKQAYDPERRARFYTKCREAVYNAVRGVRNKRARRRAEREAIWCVLEEHGLVIRKRGSAPWPSPKADRVS
jgi:hypothetical protein